MRIVTPITLLGLAAAGLVGSSTDIESMRQRLPFMEEVSEVEVAVEVRCGELDSWIRRTCEDELVERFASGHSTPEAILRLHCTRAQTVWAQHMPDPPALCAARFGGWISS
jgi:hypothetical protein